jgi:uncharacterized protein YqjF (DUF2071 family)
LVDESGWELASLGIAFYHRILDWGVSCLLMDSKMTSAQVAAQSVLQQRPSARHPVMKQRWDQLLFLHWEADAGELQQRLPPGLTVDCFGGRAYIAVVPFLMRRIRPLYLPSLPWLSNFLELNVRTYVVDEYGTPGVWFFSLDTDRWIARTIARRFFQLPYFWAEMKARMDGDEWMDYWTVRREKSDLAPLKSEAAEYRYRGVGNACLAKPGSLEFFLLERYVLFAWNERRKQLLSGRVWHEPYRYRQAEVASFSAAPIGWDGLTMPAGEPIHQCCSERVGVDAFAVEEV